MSTKGTKKKSPTIEDREVNKNSSLITDLKNLTTIDKKIDTTYASNMVDSKPSSNPAAKKDSLKKSGKKTLTAREIARVLIMSEEKKPKIVEKDNKKKVIEYKKEIRDILVDTEVTENNISIPNEDKKNKELDDDPNLLDFVDPDGFFVTAYPDISDSDESDKVDSGYDSGYEADIEDNEEYFEITKIDPLEVEEMETPVLLYNYDLILKEKRRFLYNNLATATTNFLLINYINYLFFRREWLLAFPNSIRFKLAARKYSLRLNKYENFFYYAKRVRFDISGVRSVLQLTSRYRNKFFTFLRKSIHFNLSVGRVPFWKLKKTVYGRVINFYNVFFRCVLPFTSRRFTIILYKLFRDWSNDFQKFNGAVLRAKRRRKIRRAYSIFKVIIFPKLIYGFMRSAKYPTRKRFLQRRAFIKYMCS